MSNSERVIGLSVVGGPWSVVGGLVGSIGGLSVVSGPLSVGGVGGLVGLFGEVASRRAKSGVCVRGSGEVGSGELAWFCTGASRSAGQAGVVLGESCGWGACPTDPTGSLGSFGGASNNGSAK